MCQQEAMLLEKKLSLLLDPEWSLTHSADRQWITRGLLGGDVAMQKLELGSSPRTLQRTQNFLVQSEKDLGRLLQAYGSLYSSSNGEKPSNTITTRDTSSSSLADLSIGSAVTYHCLPTGRSEEVPKKKLSSIVKRRRRESGDLFCSEKLPPVLDQELTWYLSATPSSQAPEEANSSKLFLP